MKIRSLPDLTDEEKKQLKIRILTRVKISPKGCWEWQLRKDKGGYGRMKYKGKSEWGVHRLSYFLWKKGDQSLLVLHHCDNSKCCNPSHLYIGNNQDNINDRENRNRRITLKGEDLPHSRLTEKEVREIKEYYKNGMRIIDLSKKFNYHQANIWRIVNNKIWKHIEV